MSDQKNINAEQAGYAESGLFLLNDYFNKEFGELADIVALQIKSTHRNKMWTRDEVLILWAQAHNHRVNKRLEAQAIAEMERAASSVLNDNDKIITIY